MRTAYLIRKNTWLSTPERQIARKIAREAENKLATTPNGFDATTAVVFYAVGCATAVLGRVTERYMELLAAGEDITTMQEVFTQAQAGAFQAARAMEVLIAGRTAGSAVGEDWYGATQPKVELNTQATEEELGEGRPETMEREEELDKMDKINRMEPKTPEPPKLTRVDEAFKALPRRERRYAERQSRRDAKKHEKCQRAA